MSFAARLGAFVPSRQSGKRGLILSWSELVAPERLSDVAQRVAIEGLAHTYFIDRMLVGEGWLRLDAARAPPTPPRATFFGVKGGVGRSTSLALWARHLAKLGHKVLVVDLDLESPGVSYSMLTDEAMPQFGVLDWLIEDGVQQADDALLGDLRARSSLADDADGFIDVVPVCGTRGGLVEKLARAYLDLPGTDGKRRPFHQRIDLMLQKMTADQDYRVVLIDSRAGVHDVAAAAVAHLGAQSMLFSVGTEQSWRLYRELFEVWRARPALAKQLRENLLFVASHVPETGSEDYVKGFRARAHTLFSETLFDDVRPGEVSAFNFELEDETGPHFAPAINWRREFQTFDPTRGTSQFTDEQIEGSFNKFFRRADDLMLTP